MELKDKIVRDQLPEHVAIIMDGNGRWAKEKGNKRIYGHRNGVIAVREVTEAAAELGILYLTLYAFSKENWKRPKSEVNGLMSLLVNTINKEKKNLQKNNIRLLTIGDKDTMPEKVMRELDTAVDETAGNTGLSLVLALNYGSRWEIANALNQLLNKVNSGEIDKPDISEEIISNHLTTNNIPDPELLIRTGGEKRISNFLLWQISYTELYFTHVLWPDFRKKHFHEAIIDFQNRERRFGKTGEQTKNV
jgi:undecaprenyl diphosphate synthase